MRVASVAGVASVQVASFKKINFPPQAVPLLFKEGKKHPLLIYVEKWGRFHIFLVVSFKNAQFTMHNAQLIPAK